MKAVAAIGLAASLCAGAFATAARANLLTQKTMPAAMALAVAQAALEACAKQGYHVSVHVVGREGQMVVAIHGDGAAPQRPGQEKNAIAHFLRLRTSNANRPPRFARRRALPPPPCRPSRCADRVRFAMSAAGAGAWRVPPR